MASLKRTGFFWGEDKLTLVEFEKNAPRQVISSPLNTKSKISSPFSSNLTEEIQITTVFQKMLQDNHITGGSFYVSLPMKEIILRSFVIPFVKQEDIPNAIKFEAKKYLPIDIQSLTYAFYIVPFMENKVKRFQVIFFAVRKEFLDRYERIFKQVNAAVSYCEPSVVSLAKVLLFKKEISPTEHLAFLILDKYLGRICFINQGMPQFIREFPLSTHSPLDEVKESAGALNLKIVNEVANSFDFYARQFIGERIEQMLVSAEDAGMELISALETELKLKLRKISSVEMTGELSQSSDMDAIYAMGACVDPPVEPLSRFNFLEDKAAPKSGLGTDIFEIFRVYKEVLFVFLICAISLVGVYIFFQVQLKVVQQQYDQISAKQGAYSNVSTDSLQTEIQQKTSKLAAFKNVRMKSDMVLILLRLASHLPQGVSLSELKITYNQVDPNDAHVSIDLNGDVVGDDPNEEIEVINKIFLDFKSDKELSRFVNKVNLVSLNREAVDGKQAMGFNIEFL